MNRHGLLADMRSRGFAVTAEGDRVRVRPASLLTAADREEIRAGLADLLAELAGGHPPAPPPPSPAPPTPEPEPAPTPEPESVPAPVEWVVVDSTDPAAVGGRWVGDTWHPPGTP